MALRRHYLLLFSIGIVIADGTTAGSADSLVRARALNAPKANSTQDAEFVRNSFVMPLIILSRMYLLNQPGTPSPVFAGGRGILATSRKTSPESLEGLPTARP